MESEVEFVESYTMAVSERDGLTIRDAVGNDSEVPFVPIGEGCLVDTPLRFAPVNVEGKWEVEFREARECVQLNTYHERLSQ